MALPESAATSPSVPRQKGWRRWLKIAAVGLLAGYSLMLVLLMLFEEYMIFFPQRHPVGSWRTEGMGFPVEDANFAAADGTQLHGWYVPHDQPRAYVLFSHGNGGNLTNRWQMLGQLHQLGLAVLIYDYRGYGRSQNSPPNEARILADARAAQAWLCTRAGISPKDVVHLGESLGGGVAVDLAANDGARGLILLSTFTSLPEIAARHYPFFPVRFLMRNRLDSLSKIGRYQGPLLSAHGDTDDLVPYEFGRRLFDAAPGRKQFVTMSGYGHNEDPPEFYRAVDTFIAELEAGSDAAAAP
ncbi:MAG: alpha/beta hydrolase [Pirellulales bacterium]